MALLREAEIVVDKCNGCAEHMCGWQDHVQDPARWMKGRVETRVLQVMYVKRRSA